MVRKLAYLLVILAVLTAVGELCGLLLPTLSWPFTVSREMSMLNIVCTDQNNGGFLTPQGKFLWFGWVCVLVMGGLGFWLMLKGPGGSIQRRSPGAASSVLKASPAATYPSSFCLY